MKNLVGTNFQNVCPFHVVMILHCLQSVRSRPGNVKKHFLHFEEKNVLGIVASRSELNCLPRYKGLRSILHLQSKSKNIFYSQDFFGS